MIRSFLPRCPIAAVTAVLAVGCGFGSPSSGPRDGQPPSPDTPPTDGPLIDGPLIDGPPAASCMERWRAGTVAFGSPTQLTELGSLAVDRDPFLTPDELTIYFSTERTTLGSADVFTATRTSRTAPFGAPQRDADISSTEYDSRFTMSGNELIGIVASSRMGGEGGSDLWMSTRGSTSAKFNSWDRSMGLVNIDTAAEELDPAISADGLRIYLATGNPQRIVVSTRTAVTSSFSSTEQIAELFSNAGDADPSLSTDERIIVFSSRRTGNNSNVDLWYATRATKNDSFDTPRRVPNVNSASAGDGDPMLSLDGCRLYFASDRGGNYELYVASVTPQ